MLFVGWWGEKVLLTQQQFLFPYLEQVEQVQQVQQVTQIHQDQQVEQVQVDVISGVAWWCRNLVKGVRERSHSVPKQSHNCPLENASLTGPRNMSMHQF